jgi:hypothetical protein
VVLTIYLVVGKVRKKLSVRKYTVQEFDMERFIVQKVNDVAVKEQYQVKISDRFTALRNLHMMMTTTTSGHQ